MTDPHSHARFASQPSSVPFATRQRIQRPAVVSVLAFLGIVVASLLLFCNILVMVTEALLLRRPGQSPLKNMPPLDPAIMKVGAANAAIVALFAAILLGGCLAALSLRPAARKIILLWSVAFILCGVGRAIVEIYYVGPLTLDWVRRNRPTDPNFASGHMAAMITPNAIGVLALYCILPALFLIFWNRSDVKAAFHAPEIQA